MNPPNSLPQLHAARHLERVGFECQEEPEVWLPCDVVEGGVWTHDWFVSVGDSGSFQFEVRAVDDLGNRDPTPASWSWAVDLDGVPAELDNCPELVNPDQADLDADELGDACDPDDDGDGLADAVEDLDGDTEIDADETDPRSPDTDEDGLCDGMTEEPRLDESGEVWCELGEDLDLDGQVGDLETDPREADSDGDCLDDGEEVLDLGSDPLDPDSPEVGGSCGEPSDEAEPDAGEPDAGDAGEPDVGEPDAGEPDAGEPDAGEAEVPATGDDDEVLACLLTGTCSPAPDGCGCSATDSRSTALVLGLLALLSFLGRRRTAS